MKVKHFPKVGQSHDDTFSSLSLFVLISEMDFVPFYFSFLLYYYEWMFLCCWLFLFFIKNFNFFAPSLVFLILIILTSLLLIGNLL